MTPAFDAVAIPAGVTHPHSAASPEGVRALCEALRAARPALADRGASEIAAVLGRVGGRFLDPADPLREEALELLPATSGLSPEMATAVLDGMAADWTGARLAMLHQSELGDASVLDGFVPAPTSAAAGGRRVMAVGPELCVQIVAGSVPGVGVSALLRSLLVKGPTLLKPGRGDVVLPVLFGRALAEADRSLAAALAVVYWPGGSPLLEDVALASAEVVTAYGSDDTVRGLRARAPATVRFVPYHHRVSVGVVGRDALSRASTPGTAGAVARALGFFDQRGCVCPQVVYVEEGGERSCAEFAEALGEALADLERELPSGTLDAAEASALHQARGVAELRAGGGAGRVLHGGSASWTVLLETGPDDAGPWHLPGAGRIARVRPVGGLDGVLGPLAPVAAHLQTVGVAGLGPRLERFAQAMARLGASRVVPFQSVPFPPPWWHHDGGGPLRDLLRWVDLEP